MIDPAAKRVTTLHVARAAGRTRTCGSNYRAAARMPIHDDPAVARRHPYSRSAPRAGCGQRSQRAPAADLRLHHGDTITFGNEVIHVHRYARTHARLPLVPVARPRVHRRPAADPHLRSHRPSGRRSRRAVRQHHPPLDRVTRRHARVSRSRPSRTHRFDDRRTARAQPLRRRPQPRRIHHPEDQPMRIAVTSQNRRDITEHAGRCRNFWVFDVENGRVTGRSPARAAEGSLVPRQLAARRAPLDGVDVLIAGGMGAGCRRGLRARESRPWSLLREIRIVRCRSGSRTPCPAPRRIRTPTARTTVSTTITRRLQLLRQLRLRVTTLFPNERDRSI